MSQIRANVQSHSVTTFSIQLPEQQHGAGELCLRLRLVDDKVRREWYFRTDH